MLLGRSGLVGGPGGEARDAADAELDATVAERAWDEAAQEAPRLVGRARAGEGSVGEDGVAGAGGAGGAGGTDAASGKGALAGVRFGGVVKGADGKPAGEVKVLLMRRGGGALIELSTDANGRFAAEIPPGRYDIAVRGEGLGGLNLPGYLVDGATGTDLELTLQPVHRLEVTVLRQGQGLAGTDVAVDPRQGIGGVAMKTDGAGVAVFENLVAGSYRVTATLETNEVIRRYNVDLRKDETLQLEVPAGVPLHGTVENGDEGGPVEGATVAAWVRGPGGTWITVSGETEQDGRYGLEVPAGAVGRFEVTADDFAAWPDRKQIRQVLRQLAGVARGKETQFDVTLTRGLSIGGLVTDTENAPVPNLELSFKTRRGAPRTVRTDEDGRYLLGGITPERYDVTVLTEGWFSSQPLMVAVPKLEAGSVHPYDVQVQTTIALQGEVWHHDDSPAAGARVWVTGGGRLLRAAHDAGRDLETFTDGRGFWRITDLPSNQGVVLRAALGTLEATPRGIRTDALPDKPIRLVLAPTVSVKGTVLDAASRRPVASARVALRPNGPPGGRTGLNVTTDEEGTFEAFDLIPGSWELTPQKVGYLSAQPLVRPLEEGEDEVQVTLYLDPGLPVAGTVVDLQGRGLERARVTVTGTTNEGKRFARSALTDAHGEFRITGLEPGDYRLLARRTGYRNRLVADLRGGEERLTVEMRPRP